jgi:hypothetical protein
MGCKPIRFPSLMGFRWVGLADLLGNFRNFFIILMEVIVQIRLPAKRLYPSHFRYHFRKILPFLFPTPIITDTKWNGQCKPEAAAGNLENFRTVFTRSAMNANSRKSWDCNIFSLLFCSSSPLFYSDCSRFHTLTTVHASCSSLLVVNPMRPVIDHSHEC